MFSKAATPCSPQVDLPTFLLLSDDDLKEIGVKTVGARKKMLKLIAGLCHAPLHSKAAGTPRAGEKKRKGGRAWPKRLRGKCARKVRSANEKNGKSRA